MVLREEQRGCLENMWTNIKHATSYVGPYQLYQIVQKEGNYKIGLKYKAFFFIKLKTVFSAKESSEKVSQTSHFDGFHIHYMGWRFARRAKHI